MTERPQLVFESESDEKTSDEKMTDQIEKLLNFFNSDTPDFVDIKEYIQKMKIDDRNELFIKLSDRLVSLNSCTLDLLTKLGLFRVCGINVDQPD